MFIKVTNTADNRKGDPLLLNINNIVSVFEEHVVGGSLKTAIYVQQDLTYFVEESVEQVFALIKESRK